MNYQIKEMKDRSWDQIRRIYLEGLVTGNATFQTEAPSWEEWDKGHLKHSRLVACAEDNSILGWAALSPISVRECYRGVTEVSIYVGEKGRGQGIGNALMKALIDSSEDNGVWTLYSSIFPENEASVKLHLRHGFREIGRRERIAKLNGVWRDTVLFERRSLIVGID